MPRDDIFSRVPGPTYLCYRFGPGLEGLYPIHLQEEITEAYLRCTAAYEEKEAEKANISTKKIPKKR